MGKLGQEVHVCGLERAQQPNRFKPVVKPLKVSKNFSCFSIDAGIHNLLECKLPGLFLKIWIS